MTKKLVRRYGLRCGPGIPRTLLRYPTGVPVVREAREQKDTETSLAVDQRWFQDLFLTAGIASELSIYLPFTSV